MRILWITNNLLPDICEHLHMPEVTKTGWLHSAANQIKSEVKLSVAALYAGHELKQISLNGINYILVPALKDKRIYDDSLSVYWKTIKKTVNPDVVHIHGTEYPAGLGYIESCGANGVVISIQGLISEIAKYYNFGLDNLEILEYISLRDILKRETLWRQARSFQVRGKYECEYLRRGINFIGRTNWDKAHIKTFNPAANYYFNNETLRNSFYESEWSLEKAEKHTIFFSQATYPMKGLHILIKAIPIVLRKFPDTLIRVAGFDLTKASHSALAGRLRATTYGNYLHSLLCKYDVEKNIQFTGNLSETEMCDMYLKSHVYVNASALENSSNSIGEAQLLGVPVVASFVGGTDSIVTNNESGLLYPADDVTRLADCIIRVFEDDTLALCLSENGRLQARDRHDKTKNKDRLLEIYRDISSQFSS